MTKNLNGLQQLMSVNLSCMGFILKVMKRYYAKVAVPEITSIRHGTMFELVEKNKAVKSEAVLLKMQQRISNIYRPGG